MFLSPPLTYILAKRLFGVLGATCFFISRASAMRCWPVRSGIAAVTSVANLPCGRYLGKSRLPCAYVCVDVELGLKSRLFLDRTKHNILARHKTQHGTINFGPCQHGMNARPVPCLRTRHDGCHNTTRILDRAWAGTTQK